jgi:serine/threonine-protein kinase
VNSLRYEDAEAYCRSRGARLPTEPEWVAAAGPAGTFPWGDAEADGSRVNACDRECQSLPGLPRYLRGNSLGEGDDGFATTAPASAFEGGGTPSGVLQLAGNVSELVDAWHGEEQRFRVMRGGSWSSVEAAELQATARARISPETRTSDVGFRCAADRETP